MDWSPKATAWGLHEIGDAETVAQPCVCVRVCVRVCVCVRTRAYTFPIVSCEVFPGPCTGDIEAKGE